MKYPEFPKSLFLKTWDAAAKKEGLDAPKASDAIETLADAYKNIEWDDLALDDADDHDYDNLNDYEKDLVKALVPVRDAADDALKILKKIKSDLADTSTDKINGLLKEISAFEKEALTGVKKLLENVEDEDEDEDDEDKGGEIGGYNLKKLLRLVKKKTLKFALAKVNLDSLPVPAQLFIGKKLPNKNLIASQYPAYGKPKILAKGIVTFKDGVFTFATKNAPKPAFEKLFRKIFKVQKCLPLGEIALRQITKGEDPELDADTEALEVADTDLGDISDDTEGVSPPLSPAPNLKDILEKIKPEIAKALAKNSLISAENREQLTNLVVLAKRQLDDRQEPKAIASIQAIRKLLKDFAETAAKDSSKDSSIDLSPLTDLLQKLGVAFQKSGITDKLIVSEFSTLVRRAQRQIGEKNETATKETLREIQQLLIRNAKAGSGAKPVSEATEAVPPPAPPPPPPPKSSGKPAGTEEPTTAARKEESPEKKVAPFVKFNTVRIESWNAAQKTATTQIEAFKKAVFAASKDEDDFADIEKAVASLMDEIIGYGETITDSLDKLANEWQKISAAVRRQNLSEKELALLESEQEKRRVQIRSTLDDYKKSLDKHSITKELDDNPFGSFGITTTLENAISKLNASLL